MNNGSTIPTKRICDAILPELEKMIEQVKAMREEAEQRNLITKQEPHD